MRRILVNGPQGATRLLLEYRFDSRDGYRTGGSCCGMI